MGEKINFYASHTLVYSLLNADVALSCPIQLYRTGLSELGVGGGLPSQIWADQLTLSQSRGQIMPTTILLAPLPGFSDFPTALRSMYCMLCSVQKRVLCWSH